MEKTRENNSGVISITHKAGLHNTEIGNYEEHFINENFNYKVMLDNGYIIIPRTMAQDIEVQPTSITEKDIIQVADSFVPFDE